MAAQAAPVPASQFTYWLPSPPPPPAEGDQGFSVEATQPKMVEVGAGSSEQEGWRGGGEGATTVGHTPRCGSSQQAKMQCSLNMRQPVHYGVAAL